MTRPLLITAGLSFVVAVICFAVVAAIGPIDPFNWSMFHHDHGRHGWHGWRAWPTISTDGPQVSRDLVWSGTDQLAVEAPAEVTYTQGPVAHLSVSGPQEMVDHLVVEDGALRLDGSLRGEGRLQIALTAPLVHRFAIDGAKRLSIVGYDQDSLQLALHGSGDVVARGKTRNLDLAMAGSGDVDMGGLDADTANVAIAGSGDAAVAPRSSARIAILGSGDVTLTTQPANLESHVIGSGSIRRAPSAPPPPAPKKG
ncbi:MAG TPA: DUF2807 domain-containing protein [Caulobacteraceae bacterium]|jgi:hypothetical protein|nr:DUF2807 domain-containing protein [Caulobacteraceae bacterium]